MDHLRYYWAIIAANFELNMGKWLFSDSWLAKLTLIPGSFFIAVIALILWGFERAAKALREG